MRCEKFSDVASHKALTHMAEGCMHALCVCVCVSCIHCTSEINLFQSCNVTRSCPHLAARYCKRIPLWRPRQKARSKRPCKFTRVWGGGCLLGVCVCLRLSLSVHTPPQSTAPTHTSSWDSEGKRSARGPKVHLALATAEGEKSAGGVPCLLKQSRVCVAS